MMHWASWTDFFAMGGYALYVWLAFGLTAFCLAWEVLAVRHRYAQALRRSRLFDGMDAD